MKKILLCAWAIFLLIFISVNAQAYLVPQPPQPPSTTTLMGYSSNANDYYGPSWEADNFTLPSASTITGIKWWGFDEGGGWSGTSRFTFTFYADNNGIPGDSILTTSVTPTSGNPDSNYSGNSVWVYTSALGVPLNAGTYWVSIFDTTTNSTWGWMMSDGGTSYQQLYGGWNQMYSNAAFELTGSPVPIPTAAWLLGSGLIALVLIRRRMRVR